MGPSGFKSSNRTQCAFQRGQRITQGPLQFASSLGGRHPSGARQQERIIKKLSQPAQLQADGRLREIEQARCPRHILLGQQGIQCDQQIKIQTAQAIVHANTMCFGNSFLS
ncbi:hypothetical protein CFII68_01485 [Pseudomonas sp. CFII68]|nr:hypothetical protein CFII68_01485 [Pseudomonas sp. CFII68]